MVVVGAAVPNANPVDAEVVAGWPNPKPELGVVVVPNAKPEFAVDAVGIPKVNPEVVVAAAAGAAAPKENPVFAGAVVF